MFCDSQNAIHSSKNQMYHERTKHIDVSYHFIRENVSQCIIIVKKVPTTNYPTYMMSKPSSFEQVQEMLGLGLDLVDVCSL